MGEDKKERLKTEPFGYRLLKDEKIQVFYEGKPILMLSGKKATDLKRKLEPADDFNQQLLLAKATGNFKRGNEKHSKNTLKY